MPDWAARSWHGERGGRIRLVVIDDHPAVLKGLKAFFDAEPDLDLVAACSSGEDGLEALRKYRPDVLVLDLRMRGLDGLAVLRAMKQERSSARVVVLTADIDTNETLEAVRLGVNGVVLKEMAPQLLMQCIRKVHAGEQWLERDTVGRALATMVRRQAGLNDVRGLLTARELEIVGMAVRGLRNTEIAAQLSLSESTVKTHLHRIYAKLAVQGRVGLILLAREKGLA
jgi:DNA-binding NarL/FixJ family response regulator